MKEIFVSVSGPIEGNHGPCKSRAIRGYKQHCRQEQFVEGLYSESNGRFITLYCRLPVLQRENGEQSRQNQDSRS